MDQPPDDHDQQTAKTLLGLVATIVLVALTVLLLVKLKSDNEMQDCFAQGRHNCDPIDMTKSQ